VVGEEGIGVSVTLSDVYVTETMVEVSCSERRERCGRASFLRKMRDIIVVGDPLISDGRSGSHRTNTVFEPSNQAH